MQVASQLYLWLEDQDGRDEAAAESAAAKLRAIYRREVECDVAGIVLRRDARQRATASSASKAGDRENGGGVRGNNTGGSEQDSDEEESDGWGAGGVHYSEYLAAAAAATKAMEGVNLAGRATSLHAVPLKASRGDTTNPLPVERSTGNSPPAPPFTPAATLIAADFASPSVRTRLL